MSNIDSLLDLDDMNSDPPREVKDTTGVTSADPFDPFATQYDQTPSDNDQKASFTGFDPFAQIVESPDTISPSDPFEGSDPFSQNGTNGKVSTHSGLIDLGEITEETDTRDDFDPFSSSVTASRHNQSNSRAEEQEAVIHGQIDLLGGALTTDDIEGLEGSYDVSEGRIHAQPDLIQEEDEDDEDEEEEEDEDEENSVVEKDDLPEKIASVTTTVNDMASMSDSERREYESQFDNLMTMGPPETNGHHEFEEEYHEEEDDYNDSNVSAEASFTVKSDTSYPMDDRYSPPESPTTHTGDQVVTTTEGGNYESGAEITSPSRLEDTLPTFQQPKRYVKPEEKRESKHAPGVIIMSQAGAGDNRCALCDKRVYEMEKMIADKNIYHKMCFRCTHCKRILSLGNFASMEGRVYCKPHFIEIFKTKGNYDEGFGKERHSRHWQNKEVPVGKTEPTTVAKSEEPTTPSGDVVRADDKVDDGIDSVPSIGNIKSRFQEHDERPPMPGERSSFGKSTNGHVNGDHTPPEVVNRSESQEEILERELPPANLARNMASRFRDMESDGPVERKPVRKITPPREEVERDVTYVRESLDRDPNVVRSDTSAEKEDERPPPSFTKNMLAKFKEMEDTTNPPPSPARSAISPTKRTAISHQQFATYTRASPDEGIADTEPSETNGHRAEVIREGDKSETEELPERGFTKSLLAQWRQIESTAPTESAKSLAPRQTTPGRGGSYRQASPSNSQDEDGNREVVRGGDSNEEEFLPPPSYTKNMLAKFQTLQDESTTDQGSASSKKQFKWEVREAKPLWGGVPSRVQLSPEAVTNGHEGNGEVFSSDEEQEEEYIDETELECDEYGNPIYPINHPRHPDNVHRRREKRSSSSQREVVRSGESAEPEEELPAPETTRRLLSQFKSMEDVAAPVPTPERVAQQQRLLRSSSSGGQQQSDRRTSQASEEREQPDGTDNLDYPLQSEQHYEDSGEYENNPVYREDVVRETDQDENEDLPEQGITRNLLAKFQSMQAV